MSMVLIEGGIWVVWIILRGRYFLSREVFVEDILFECVGGD